MASSVELGGERGARARTEGVAPAAAGLVGPLRTEQQAVAARHQPLRVVRGVAAHHADGERLGDVLGDGEELRHGFERLAAIVLVEAGDDHPHPGVGEVGRQIAFFSSAR